MLARFVRQKNNSRVILNDIAQGQTFVLAAMAFKIGMSSNLISQLFTLRKSFSKPSLAAENCSRA